MHTTAGAGTWAFCGVLCCPVAGSFDRLTSTGPRTHHRLWPRLPQGHRLLRARRQPLLSRRATGWRAEYRRELPTSKTAPLADVCAVDHSADGRAAAGPAGVAGRRRWAPREPGEARRGQAWRAHPVPAAPSRPQPAFRNTRGTTAVSSADSRWGAVRFGCSGSGLDTIAARQCSSPHFGSWQRGSRQYGRQQEPAISSSRSRCPYRLGFDGCCRASCQKEQPGR